MEKIEEKKTVYKPEDIQRMLDIGRSKTYQFLEEVYENQTPFKIIRVGTLYRVPVEPFDRWLNGEL